MDFVFVTENPALSDLDKLGKIWDAIAAAGWGLPEFLYNLFSVDTKSNTRLHSSLRSILGTQKARYKATDIVDLMYTHPLSRPPARHKDIPKYFSAKPDPENPAKYCQPALSTWAFQLVLKEIIVQARVLEKCKELRVRATRRQSAAGTDSRPREEEATASHEGRQVVAQLPEDLDEEALMHWGTVGDEAREDEDDPMDGTRSNTVAAPGSGRRTPPRKQKGSTSKDDLASWQVLDHFSFEKLAHLYKREAPVIWAILLAIVNFIEEMGTTGYRPKETVCTSVLSELVFSRSQWTNLFPLVRSVALFATRAHQSAYRVGSRLGQNLTYSSTRNLLVTTANRELELLKNRFQNLGDEDPILIVFDNMQTLARRRDIRIGTKNRFIIGTGATAIEMQDCPPGAFKLDPIREKYNSGARRNLRVEDILKEYDLDHFDVVFQFHFLEALVSYVPALAGYRSEVNELFELRTKKHQINPHRNTKVHPLGTNSSNETTTKGMKEALFDFIQQLGITPDSSKGHFMFFHGDGKSYEGMLTVKRLLSGNPNDFNALRMVQPVLELWHTKATALSRICGGFWGSGHDLDDPSTLGFMAKLLGFSTPSDMHKVDFYQNSHLLDIVVRGHMLNAWETLCKDDLAEGSEAQRPFDLCEHYAQLAMGGNLPPLAELVTDAALLARRYTSTQAFEKATLPRTSKNKHTDDAPQGPASPTPKCDGDQALANSCMLMREGTMYLEVCRATAIGDVGRIWQVLLRWIFSFSGAGHSNYAAYLTEMFCAIMHEFPPETVIALFNNWLVNFVGKPGHFHEIDLMQEHFNGWLEELAQHKGQEFDEEWYREVLSRHVHRFVRVIQELEKKVGLEARRTTHGEPPSTNEIREVKRVCRDNDLHRRHEGRHLGFEVPDHWTMGYTRMANGKLGQYIEKSMQEWDNMHKDIPMPRGYEDMTVYMHAPITVEDGRMDIVGDYDKSVVGDIVLA